MYANLLVGYFLPLNLPILHIFVPEYVVIQLEEFNAISYDFCLEKVIHDLFFVSSEMKSDSDLQPQATWKRDVSC